jgi:ABC-type glutathione transport system ATPase component
VPDDVRAPLLRVSGLDVTLGRGRRANHVLHGADLSVDRGEIVGLIGETGSGKTTLARSVLGTVSPSSGSVFVDGIDIVALGALERRELRRAGTVQYVFQDPLLSLDPDLTAAQSIGEGLHIRGGADATAIAVAVDEALAAVGLDPGLGGRNPAELSGGQRQRVAIARALVLNPQLLLCDEPVSALDAANRIQILELLGRLRDDRGLGVLFISHDLGSVAGIADRIVVLYRGRVVEEGATADVILQPQHPYTRLLLGSAPTLAGGEADRGRRQELRRLLAAEPH